jgi:NAD(P)-dependent dehydrogenase (short-subunit alcohol dehydrogenase family)
MTVLAGRRAIVTGAAHGLGLAFAEALADAGAAVAVCDIDPEVATVDAAAIAAVADVSDPAAVREFVDVAAERLGGLDIVVNNAGIVRQTAPVSDSWEKTIDDYDAVMGANFRGAYLIGRAAIPHLVRRGGDIVNITTDHVHTCGYPEAVDHSDASDCRWAETRRPPLGNATFDIYDASKFALAGLTHVWARALAEHGVRVNSFGMGATETPMMLRHLERKGVPPPDNLMKAELVAQILVELIAEGPEGRTGDSVQLWTDHPCVLPPPSLYGRLSADVQFRAQPS